MPTLPVSQASATHAVIRGRHVLVFGGCNYLGLAQHPAVLAAAARAMTRFGLSTSASRKTTGNTTLHDELEQALADFLGQPAAVVVPDGYSANLAAAQALAADHRVAVMDRRAHMSLREAARVAGMEIIEYEHRDADEACRLAAAHADRGVVVCTDGVFAADGRIAPLTKLLNALPPHALLMVDDCHGVGVLGSGGAGTPAHLGLADPRIVLTSTLAKGLGCHGGVVAGAAWIVERLRATASAYVCTTPVSPVLAAAALEALAVIRREPQRVERVRQHARRLDAAVAALGFPPCDDPTPIRAFAFDSEQRMREVQAALLAEGVLAPLIAYPGGPAPLYFRLAVSAEHTPEHLDLLASLLARYGATTPQAPLGRNGSAVSARSSSAAFSQP